MSGREGISPRRLCFTLFVGLLAAVLAFALTATYQFRQLLGSIQYTAQEAPAPLPQLHSESPDSGQAVLQPVSQVQNSSAEETGDSVTNILLIGQDTRQADSRARSDAMILCSFRPGSSQLTVISFLRDLYVQIPGFGSNRLNAAYAIGGMSLLRQTFDENFGIRIDGCMEVDFERFVQLVDLVDGVTVPLRQDEADAINHSVPEFCLSEGDQCLNGQQALAYVRIRNLDADGDFSRTLRQRRLLTAMLERMRSSSLYQLLELLRSALPLISTDMAEAEIASCAAAFLPMLSGLELKTLRIPEDGSYEPKTIQGMAVLVADPEKTKSLLESALSEP